MSSSDEEMRGHTVEEPKLFLLFTEHNHKHNEIYYFLLQWEGNEEALTLQHELVEKSGGDYDIGDTSSFRMSLEKKLISPTTIREIDALGLGCYWSRPITFCEGIIENPPFSTDDLADEDIARLLDGWFFDCRVADMFKQ